MLPSASKRVARRVYVLTCSAVVLLSAGTVRAEVRRAVIVGINEYETQARPVRRQTSAQAGAGSEAAKKKRGTFTNLEGAVPDALAFRDVLVARYGFKLEDIVTLVDREATREQILSAIRRQLVDAASPGDVSVFFYAGHGSQVPNTASTEADGLDESIVPADSEAGAPDIRDKEWARLFNAALDKQVLLTAIFDSCHSGSIARGGLPGSMTARFAPPSGDPVNDPGEPERRGAVIISAAIAEQVAQEIVDADGVSHGVFSTALVTQLRSMPTTLPVSRMFAGLKASMQANGSMQQPVLAGVPDSVERPFLGVGPRASDASRAIAVVRTGPGGVVTLQGGRDFGLVPGAELRSTTNHDVVLTVTQLDGLSQSTARAERPDAIHPGDLFEVVRFAPVDLARLRVAVGSGNLPFGEVASLARSATDAFNGATDVALVSDPAGSPLPIDGVLRWNQSAWQFRTAGGQVTQVRGPLTADSLGRVTGRERSAGTTRRSVAMQLPAPAELATLLSNGLRGAGVEFTAEERRSEYQLMVRAAAAGGLEFAWIRPNATLSELAALPARTSWVIARSASELDRAADQLENQLLTILRARSWLTLEPPQDRGAFPYHLALRNTQTGAVTTAGPLEEGGGYVPILQRDPGAPRAERASRRHVYVFAIDQAGAGFLLYPPLGAGNADNLVPLLGVKEDPLEMALTNPRAQEGDRRLFTIAPPLGLDTYFLLSADEPLTDPSILSWDPVAVRTPNESRAPGDPLSRLVLSTTFSRSPNPARSIASWSLEKLSIQSVGRSK